METEHKACVLIILFLIISDVSSFGSNISTIRLEKTRLLADLRAYSTFKDKISPCGDDNMVNLTFQYNHHEVLTLDEVDQTLTSVGYVSLMWVDSDLTWNKTDYRGVDLLSIPCSEIWHPTIIVTNAADQDYLTIDQIETLTLSSDGVVTYVTPVYLKTTCNMDLKYYPFDIQKCYIIFMPFVDDVKFSISVESTDGFVDHFSITGQWQMLSSHISADLVDYQSGHQIVNFTMVIQRRYMYYVVYILAPMVLTSSMTSIVFWIPPHSGEKISFLVTVFASNAVFLNFIAGTMPRNMTNMPLVTIFLIFVNIQCLIAMIATAFVLRIFDREQEDTMAVDESVFPKQTDHTINSPKNEVEAVAETKGTKGESSYLKTNRFSACLLRKPAFFSSKVAPLEQSQNKSRQVSHKRRRRCCIRASTLDIIFFFLFHLTSTPIYYLLFEMNM